MFENQTGSRVPSGGMIGRQSRREGSLVTWISWGVGGQVARATGIKSLCRSVPAVVTQQSFSRSRRKPTHKFSPESSSPVPQAEASHWPSPPPQLRAVHSLRVSGPF